MYLGPKADNLPFKDCADDESPYSKSGFVMFYVHYVHEGPPHGQQMHPRLCCVCYVLISHVELAHTVHAVHHRHGQMKVMNAETADMYTFIFNLTVLACCTVDMS